MKPIQELHSLIDELTAFIQDLAPEVRVEYENFIFTDEDANLSVFPPLSWDDERCWALQQKITEHAVERHLETGYLILASVYTPAQQVTEIQSELAKSKQRVEVLENALSEAEALGLFQSTHRHVTLVAA
jgi:hypothetical protein